MTLYTWWRKRKTRRIGLHKSAGGVIKEIESSTEKEEETKAVKYPIITIIQKSKSSGSGDEHSIASSNISSLYDTQSQLHDQSWFEEAKQMNDMMEEVKRIRQAESGLIPLDRSEEAPFYVSNSASETWKNKSSQQSISILLPPRNKSPTASNIVGDVELEQNDSRDDDDDLDPRRTVISI